MAMTVCALKRPRKRRGQINLTIDPDVLRRVRDLMSELGETSLSNFTEGLYECVLRDTCDGCPAYEELSDAEKRKVKGKIGVGKQIVEED